MLHWQRLRKGLCLGGPFSQKLCNLPNVIIALILFQIARILAMEQAAIIFQHKQMWITGNFGELA